MHDVILHHYDASPFTQKALKMLALKNLSWGSVEMPMIAPKPNLTPLTGGYRGTPVLQCGADVYVDNARILQELDTRYQEPAISGAQFALSDAAMCGWGEQFFEAGLYMAIHEYADHWDSAFTTDRKEVFARLDFQDVKEQYREACGLLRVHAGLLDRQLSDGRHYLRGERPGMADIHAWPVLWFTRNMPLTNGMLEAYRHLPVWEKRVHELGEGERETLQPAEALAAARAAEPVGSVSVDHDDPLALKDGDNVAVQATFSNRGTSHGTLVGLNASEIAIELNSREIGKVHVHFPRLGYRVTRI